MIVFFLFIFGLIIGSFLGAYVTRFARGESVVRGRSHCDHCNNKLGWQENIPLLSWSIQRGKCRQCKTKLGLFYPSIELATALTFIVVGFLIIDTSGHLSLAVNFISLSFWLIIACSLIVVFFTDLIYGLIPDSAVLTGVLAALSLKLLDLVVAVWSFRGTLLNSGGTLGKELFKNGYFADHVKFYYLLPFGLDVAAAVVVTLFFLMLVVITKGKGMGLGDVKFAFLLGLICGFPKTLVAVFFAFIAGAAWSVLLIILKRKTLKQTIHFGPFLVLSIPIALIFGDQLLKMYLGVYSH